MTIVQAQRKNIFSKVEGLFTTQENENEKNQENNQDHKSNILYGGFQGTPLLTQIGNIIDSVWADLPRLFYDVEIHDYVIMPNHFHGIISLGDSPRWRNKGSAVSLGNIIKAFKSKSTNKIKKEGLFHAPIFWQKSFYDRIIRNENEFYQLRKYILDNPAKWELDNLNPLKNNNTKSI